MILRSMRSTAAKPNVSSFLLSYRSPTLIPPAPWSFLALWREGHAVLALSLSGAKGRIRISWIKAFRQTASDLAFLRSARERHLKCWICAAFGVGLTFRHVTPGRYTAVYRRSSAKRYSLNFQSRSNGFQRDAVHDTKEKPKPPSKSFHQKQICIASESKAALAHDQSP